MVIRAHNANEPQKQAVNIVGNTVDNLMIKYMKNLFIFFMLILPALTTAQDDMYRGTTIEYKTNTNEPRIFNKSNTTSIMALSIYEKDNNGYYHLSENKPVDIIKGAETYAYDKKTRKLYVETYNGNYEITLNKELAGIYKKNKFIPQVNGDKLIHLINKVNNKLSANFNKINEDVKIAEQQKKKLQEQERQNEIKKTNYIKTHEWNILPIGTIPLECDYCSQFTSADTVYIFSMKNDSICYASVEDFDLGTKLIKWHVSKIPDYVKKNNKFAYHCDVFKDSLKNHEFDFDKGLIEYMNAKNFLDVFNIIKKKAPNGYFVDWGWDNEYGCVTFNFKYMNTSPKPIKYIKVYWTIKNDVGDVRGSGSFSGTGPVESMSSASWEWNHSSYYVAGDASKMRITRVVITYINGTTKTLTGNNIIFN